MSRKVWMGVCVLVFMSLAVVSFQWPSAIPDHSINRDGFNRIEHGMTQREVEEILGKPPGYHARDLVWVPVLTIGSPPWEEPVEWVSDEGAVFAYFREGRVVDIQFAEVGHWSYFDRLRWQLGL